MTQYEIDATYKDEQRTEATTTRVTAKTPLEAERKAEQKIKFGRAGGTVTINNLRRV